VQFGRRRTSRRGSGDEIAGTRPYRPGDPVATIHWAASARLSAARGSDEFVVREFFADQAPRVALVHDRGPGMAIHAPPSPWLDKRRVAETAGRLIAASAAAEHGEVVRVDGPLHTSEEPPYDAPEDGLHRSLEALLRRPARLPSGSFVFVVSDFLVPVPAAAGVPETMLPASTPCTLPPVTFAVMICASAQEPQPAASVNRHARICFFT